MALLMSVLVVALCLILQECCGEETNSKPGPSEMICTKKGASPKRRKNWAWMKEKNGEIHKKYTGTWNPWNPWNFNRVPGLTIWSQHWTYVLDDDVNVYFNLCKKQGYDYAQPYGGDEYHFYLLQVDYRCKPGWIRQNSKYYESTVTTGCHNVLNAERD